MPRFGKRGDRQAAGVLAAGWWPALEFAVGYHKAALGWLKTVPSK